MTQQIIPTDKYGEIHVNPDKTHPDATIIAQGETDVAGVQAVGASPSQLAALIPVLYARWREIDRAAAGKWRIGP